ncbi:MAG: ABC transporter permease [Bacteroidetes bacterium]|nr:ABC transporter permease [Bacteroidota bacterium]
MIKNYFKTTFRIFMRNKGYTFLNIFGLSIGMAISIIGLLYVFNELSYDRFNKNADRIHRIAVEALSGTTEIYQTYTAAAYTKALYDDFPEIEKITRIASWDFEFEYQDKNFIENEVFIVDSTFFDIFTIPVIAGKPDRLLNEPNCVVLTESTAKKYFGNANPINQIIRSDTVSYKVIAVVQDVPKNSHFHFNIALSLISIDGSYNNPAWFANNFRAYILLHKNVDYKAVEAKFPAFVDKYLFGGTYAERSSGGNKWELYLQPLLSIHLNSDLRGEFEANGRKEYVNVFLIVSIFILLIACINFINLSTAKSTRRAKEVGIRKVIGSGKLELIKQFIGESLTTSFIALILALVFVEIILALLPEFIGLDLQMPYFSIIYTIPGLIFLGIFVGIISGIYPAMVLSAFRPIVVLKGTLSQGGKSAWLRNALVIFQFMISVILIIGTFVISSQLNLLQNENLGFNKEEVIVINNTSTLGNSIQVVKNEISTLPFVQNVSFSSRLPGIPLSNWGCRAEGREGGFTLNLFYSDEDLDDVLNLELTKGRYFSKEYGTDTLAIIINEEAEKLIGFDEILGARITFGRNVYLHVIGVVKNIHYESKHQKIHPMAILNNNSRNNFSGYLTVRVSSDNVAQMITGLTDIWDKHAQGIPIDYNFLDKQYDALYDNEMQTKKLFLAFSFLAIFIACLGLLGLASYMAQQKTKEIGIRKTFGASMTNITLLLSKSFSKWVIIANIIAWPIAWYFFNNWLNNFTEREELAWWYFALAAVISIFIALLTIGYQTISASKANPIDSLRYE